MRWIACLLLGAVAVFGCAAGDWRRVRSEDTAASYHRFLREHPRSSRTPEAHARLGLAQLRSKPSVKGYEAFVAEFPNSPLMVELRPLMETSFFERARAIGTADAYRSFREDYPDGELALRAAGNAEYLEQHGFGGRTAELADFAARHPNSDFSAEASRSVSTAAARDQSAFDRVGLVIEIAEPTPGQDRLRRSFTDHAVHRFEAAGIELIPLNGPADPNGASLPVRLHIQHAEERVRPEVTAGEVTRPGILATTSVSLTRAGEGESIWSDRFEFRNSDVVQREDTSILFDPGARPYWDGFFVPVASWSTQLSLRRPLALEKPAVAVEVVGIRAFVLFADGDFHVYELGDPAQPLLLARYERPRDLARWNDLRVLGSRVVVFGEEGLELVRLDGGGSQRVRALARDQVGSIVGVEAIAGHLVAASNRGLVEIAPEGSPQVLIDREIRGVARLGERLLFTDGNSLYVSTLPLLRQQKVEAKLRLGKAIGPGRIRVVGSSAIVLTDRGVVRIDLADPKTPRVVERIDNTVAGQVTDAALVGGRLFLLGERGLQLIDSARGNVVDSTDVRARARLATAGRHIVAVEDATLQVVDTTPFLTARPLAAPQP